MHMNKVTHRINEHAISIEQASGVAAIENINFHFGQSAEDSTLLRLFYQKKGGFYVDIGCYDPNRYSNTFLLHHMSGWKGINIDPSGDVIEKFNSKRPNDINIKAAVGAPGKQLYYEFDSAARNTLSKKNLERQKNKGDVKLLNKTELTTKNLSDILDLNMPLGTEIDFFDIDVEGKELEVLKSNKWDKYSPSVILIEDYSIADGNYEQSEIRGYLEPKGYFFAGHNFDTSVYILRDKKDNLAKNLNEISRSEFIDKLEATINNSSAQSIFAKFRRLEYDNKKLTKKVRALNEKIKTSTKIY